MSAGIVGINGAIGVLLEKCRSLLSDGGVIVLADMMSPALVGAIDSDRRLSCVRREDVSEEVWFTADAIQSLHDEFMRPYRDALFAALAIASPHLVASLERTLRELPNDDLRGLFSGRLIESERGNDRR